MTLLGKGGMGAVYLLEDTASGRRQALKLLRPELVASREHVERFTREARAASLCAHPNVVDVIDSGFLADGRAYILMEYLEGEDLAATLRSEGRLPWARVRHIALQICDALAAAHDRGFVHRDLKPGNCFRITRAGDPDFIKVLDFGVAKLLDRSYETLTRPGELVGTPRYMAPEQVKGEPIDLRADVYALGAMLYHMLTGQTAATGSNNLEIIYSLVMRPPEPFSVVAPDLIFDDGVWPVVARAMASEPGQRFASMREFAAAIAAIGAPPVHAPLKRPALRLVAAPNLPDVPHRLVSPATPVAASGPLVTLSPARTREARGLQILASLVMFSPVCLLWVSGLVAAPPHAVAPTLRTPRVPPPPPEQTPSSSQSSHAPPADLPAGPDPDNSTAEMPGAPKGPGANSSAQGPKPERRRTVQDVVAANKHRYSRCLREELRTDPTAPRRYVMTITVDPGGKAQQIEVLSIASSAMKSCIEKVTRELTFPAPQEGSEKAIVSLSLLPPL